MVADDIGNRSAASKVRLWCGGGPSAGLGRRCLEGLRGRWSSSSFVCRAGRSSALPGLAGLRLLRSNSVSDRSDFVSILLESLEKIWDYFLMKAAEHWKDEQDILRKVLFQKSKWLKNTPRSCLGALHVQFPFCPTPSQVPTPLCPYGLVILAKIIEREEKHKTLIHEFIIFWLFAMIKK